MTLSGDSNFPYQIDLKEIIGVDKIPKVYDFRTGAGSGSFEIKGNGIINIEIQDCLYIVFQIQGSSDEIFIIPDPVIYTGSVTGDAIPIGTIGYFNPTAKRGTYYSQNLHVLNSELVHGSSLYSLYDTTLPVTWSIVSGSLPPGLTLNASTGEISGIPT